MPRPPLALNAWGIIPRPTPYRRVSPKKSSRLVRVGRRHYLPADVDKAGNTLPGATSVTPDFWKVRARYRDASGHISQPEATGDSEAAAKRSLLASPPVAKQGAGTGVTSSMTVTDAAGLYLDRREVDGTLGITSLKQYRGAVVSELGPLLGDVRMAELTFAGIEAALRTIVLGTPAVDGKPAVKGRPGKLGHARAVLGGAIGLAMSHGAITSNPMLGMTISVPESTTPIVALTPADIRAMREHLIGWAAYRRPTGGPRNPQYLAALLDVMVAAGCRPSEALALRWSEVDLENGVISITGTVIGGAGVPCARKSSPKTKHGNRAIPISDWLVAELMAMRVDARFEMVFPSRAGTYQWPANVGDHWRTAFKGTKWEGIARKAMRSTFATAVGHQHGAVAVKESLGHSRESTGERYYIGAARLARDVTDVTDGYGPGASVAESEG